MLGTEYNWLIRSTHPRGSTPNIRLSREGLFTLAVGLFCALCVALPAQPPERAALVINVKDHGAIGDGRAHLVEEWINDGRYRNLKDLQRAYSFVTGTDWSVDEAAFEMAKSKLPPEGGTIYFPEGRYVAAHASWTVKKNHVRLLGDGVDRSILQTAPNVHDALVLAPYRHVGWLERAKEQFPFLSDSGQLGSESVRLSDSNWHTAFTPGDLVFIRNGTCRFDQDYGEFNEIAAADENGVLRFKHPLSRDYTLEKINWAGTVTTGFSLPKPQRKVRIAVSNEPGNFQPSVGEAITVGDQLFEVTGVSAGSLELRNPARGNSAPGTRIAAGTKIAKSRAVIKLTQSTRDFRAEKLQFIGRRKVLNLSNSYGIEFIDCRFIRAPGEGIDTRGGLTIDGDGGRWARFIRCTLEATPPWSMQFARSFGGVTFDSCTFNDANVAFTEFSFDCEITHSVFNFHGPSPEAVITVGKSGGNYRITRNRITATNAPFIFDGQLDIQSHQHRGEGSLLIRDNVIVTSGKTQVFNLKPEQSVELANNEYTARQ